MSQANFSANGMSIPEGKKKTNKSGSKSGGVAAETVHLVDLGFLVSSQGNPCRAEESLSLTNTHSSEVFPAHSFKRQTGTWVYSISRSAIRKVVTRVLVDERIWTRYHSLSRHDFSHQVHSMRTR